MARHPTARRVHHAAEHSDDAFTERMLETTAWAKENSRMLIISGIVIVVVVLGLLYYRSYSSALRNRAATELTQVRQTVQSGNDALAIRDLEAYLTRFGGTPSAAEARLLLAQSYLRSGQAQKAIDAVKPVSTDLDTPMGPQAAFLLAGAYEAAGQPAEAGRVYLRLADDAPYMYQKRQALDSAARLRMDQGDAAGAASLYGRILDLLPEDNPERVIYELRKAEAEARATPPAS